MTYHPASAGTYNLNSSIGSTDTSITLSSFLLPVSGAQITMALLNTSIAYGTIAPRTSNSELISFTGITANSDGTSTLTGVTRGLNKTSPFTSSATFQLPHSGQSQFILSDAPQVFEKYPNRDNNEQINGLWNFSQTPTGINPSGAPDASTTTKGITELSVAPVSATTPIAVGQNDPKVPPIDVSSMTAGQVAALPGNNTDVAVGSGNKFVTQTGLQHSAENYAADSSVSANTITIALSPIPISYTAGMVIRVKVANATTSATTINVNALGAKTVKKYVAGAIADLTTNDILANQTVTMVYDAGLGFMILQSPPATLPNASGYKNGITTYDLSTASGSQNIAHGLGVIPKFIRITAFNSSGNGQPTRTQSIGVYNGTTMSCLYWTIDQTVPPTAATESSAFVVFQSTSNTNTLNQSATATFDATNIILAWTRVGATPNGTAQIMWEAFA